MNSATAVSVLVRLDGSERAEVTIEPAAQLAALADHRPGKLHLLRVVAIPSTSGRFRSLFSKRGISLTTHAMPGGRAILLDFELTTRTGKRISRALTIAGIVTVGYGLWLTWAIIH